MKSMPVAGLALAALAAALLVWWLADTPGPGFAPGAPGTGVPQPPSPATGDLAPVSPPAGTSEPAASDRQPVHVDQGLTGRIVDEAGTPLAGIQVAAVAPPPLPPFAALRQQQRGELEPACASTASAPDGTFRLPLPPAALGIPLELWVYGPGRGDQLQRLSPLAAADWRSLGDLVLPGAATVGGAVLAAADDQPIAGAVVTAWPAGSPLRALPGRDGPHRALTDAQGRYAFADLAAGIHDFTAAAPGFASIELRQQHVFASDDNVVDFALEPGGDIDGFVTDAAGAGIEGACVQAEPLGPGRLARPSATARGGGRFALRGLGAGAWQLRAGAHGYQTATSAPVTAGTRDLVLRLVPQGSVRLRVSGSDGRRLERFTVTARPPLDLPAAGLRSLPARAVEPADLVDGACLLPDLDPGDWQLEVAAPRHAKSFSAVFTVQSGAATDVAVALTRGGSIRGRLVDEQRRAVAGAAVRTEPDGHAAGDVGAIFGALQVWRVTGASARSGADGAFVLAALAAGRYQLQIERAGGAASCVRGVDVAPDASVDLGTIGCAAGSALSGTVAGIDPRTAVFVEVLALPGGALPAGQVFEAAVDAEGRWRLGSELPPGRYAVMAGRRLRDNKFQEDADRAASRVEIELRGEPTRSVALALPQ